MTNLLKNRLLSHIFIFLVMFIASSYTVGNLYCNEVYKLFSDQKLNLVTRINFALEMALRKLNGKRIWLVYSINSTNRDHDLYSSFDITSFNNKTLYQVLCEETQNSRHNAKLANPLWDQRNLFLQENNLGGSTQPTEKSDTNSTRGTTCLAIILDYSLESGRPVLYQVYAQNISTSFNLEFRSVFWLGNAGSEESLTWLKCQFYKSSQLKFKKQIIAAIGLHECEKKVVEFSKKILRGKHQLPLKLEAISLAGKFNTHEGLKALATIAIKNNKIMLRKKALFALSQFSDDKAQKVLSAIAKKEKNHEVRKEAIFWLGQIANVEAVKILGDIMKTEKNTKIREFTLLAISQLSGSQSKQLLSTAAMNDPNYRIRKKARLILRQSGDAKFMNFFDELVKSSDSPHIKNRGNRE